MKRYRCNKCGEVVMSDGDPLVCTFPFPQRTSGVCGGAFIEERWVDYDEWIKRRR